MGEGEGKLSPFSLPSFPFSPETPDTQARDLPTSRAQAFRER